MGSYFGDAIKIIRKYEGFNEKAYADPKTGKEPYTFGYGTQFYPDGSAVRQGHCCTKEKALEYLFHEVKLIDKQLKELNVHMDDSMRQALIAFIHSVGWEPFLYSAIVDFIEQEDWGAAADEISHWIFDSDHKVIGGLLERRREEVDLFLREVNANPWVSTEILLAAFRNYSAAPHQVRAIRKLEENINPYILAEFANEFNISQNPWHPFTEEELDAIFAS